MWPMEKFKIILEQMCRSKKLQQKECIDMQNKYRFVF